jgi:hypothetical protein
VKPLLDALRQPEYVHVLLNPLPIYGLSMGVLALILALAFRSRAAQVTALIVILASAASAWPVYRYGEGGYYRVHAMADADGGMWLDAHRRRAESLIGAFYALAALAAVAIAAPLRWPRLAFPLAGVTGASALFVLAIGGWIAYAGGKVRHREFRNEPPPPPAAAETKSVASVVNHYLPTAGCRDQSKPSLSRRKNPNTLHSWTGPSPI